MASSSNEGLLSASNDDVLGADANCFFYNGVGYKYLYDAYDAAYGVYSLFWGLNTGLFDADTIKKLQQDIIKY